MSPFPSIVKASGETQAFIPERLHNSLRRAGATQSAAEHITEVITENLVPGTSTKEVYARAFALLRKEGRPVAARYALRRALLDLGPTGHPFEDYVSHLFSKDGWSVETRKMIKGTCVTHEVDFYAKRGEGEFLAAELKYHNDVGYKTDLKTALYVKSRFDDIFSCNPEVRACPIDHGLLVTNTKFTSQAIAYSTCAGVELLGWGYPEKNNLRELICRTGIFPITTLTTLSRREKQILRENGVIATDQPRERRDLLASIGMSSARVGEVLAEADGLAGSSC